MAETATSKVQIQTQTTNNPKRSSVSAETKSQQAGKVRVRHILVQHEYQAQDLIKSIQRGVEFDSLARRYSLCSSAPGGGDLGLVSPKNLDEDFCFALESLKPLEISSPIRTKFGWHLIQRLV